MTKIDLQNKVVTKKGYFESYWFENENIGLSNTLFHRIIIPLEPFDSGLTYVEQPEETEIVIEWIKHSFDDISELKGVDINSERYRDMEASVYLGAAHNWIQVNKLKLVNISNNQIELEAFFKVLFENERVARNETFQTRTVLEYRGVISNY